MIGLALGNVRRWWWRYLLTALLLGAGMAVLVLGLAYVAAHGRLLSRECPRLDLPCHLVLRVPPAVRVMVDPGQPENNIPPTYRYESVFMGDLAQALGRAGVAWMEEAAAVPLVAGPLGQGQVWYVVPQGRLVSALSWQQGGPPAGPGEVGLPAEWARRAGVLPGDRVQLVLLDPATGFLREETLRVTGIYGDLAAPDVPLLSLPDREGRDFARELQEKGEVAWPYANVLLVSFQGDAGEGLFWRILENSECPVYDALTVDTPRERAASLTRQMYGPVQSLFPLLFVFAGLGVLASTLLAVLDRRRELAILKAVGIPGHQIGRVLTLEAVAAGLAACLLGWAGAVLLRHRLAGPGGRLLVLPPGMVLGGAMAVLATAALAAAGPAALARAATVTELLQGRTMRLWHQRVGSREDARATGATRAGGRGEPGIAPGGVGAVGRTGTRAARGKGG